MTDTTTKPDELLLKWGTTKGWDLHSPAAKAAMDEYSALEQSMSAMTQRMTHDHKARLCAVIDSLSDNARIVNDWSGDVYTKDQAKKYVMDYGP